MASVFRVLFATISLRCAVRYSAASADFWWRAGFRPISRSPVWQPLLLALAYRQIWCV